jgi:hypothetical protein
LGVSWSKWNESEIQSDSLAHVRLLQNAGFPLDTLIYDMQWHRTPAWGGYSWDPLRYPNVTSALQQLHSESLQIGVNFHDDDGVQQDANPELFSAFAAAVGANVNNSGISFNIGNKTYADALQSVIMEPLIAQGIDFLIEVLDNSMEREDIFFLIVGGGNQSKKIENWVNLKKPQNILYIPMISRVEFDQLELACDVGMIFLDKRFTIPNFPSRMLAYMEAKLPVLIAADNVSDAGIIAQENNFGKFSLAGNFEDFLVNLNFLHNDIEKRKQMGENGYQFLKQNYSVEIPYRNIMNEINNV